jgi:hypothetical protein
MGDVVKCRAALSRATDDRRADHLFLVLPDLRPRILACRPKGTPQREERPEWEYEERDGQLHLTPSLLATDTGFHTDYHWSCAFDLCPDGVGMYEHFYAINQDIPRGD